MLFAYLLLCSSDLEFLALTPLSQLPWPLSFFPELRKVVGLVFLPRLACLLFHLSSPSFVFAGL